MAFEVVVVSETDVKQILEAQESHFLDLKAVEVLPSKLTRSLSAFANAEGGELFVGVDENRATKSRHWRGFANPEAANAYIQTFEQFFPLGDGSSFTFLRAENEQGIVLKVEIAKSRAIKSGSDEIVYVRRGAQNLPVRSEEALALLRRNKGISSFETETVAVEPDVILESDEIKSFMKAVIPASQAEPWLRKQQLLRAGNPTVAGILLFADEPQAVLPKQSGIKLYRYNTKEPEGSRETLAFDPLSIEGCAYRQIYGAVKKAIEIVQSVRIMTTDGLKVAHYPPDALHEVITNAVLHRDYSIADDIHVRIFDNRIEILSPGTLPAHITPENILNERFSRNGVIVRLINKFPHPPNKDVGEGLNTAFAAMRDMNLKDPEITQYGGYVKVVLKHESLGTPQEIILRFLQSNEFIANRDAREICNIRSENAMKHILQRMVESGELEAVPGETRFQNKYRRAKDGDH